jgi:hypothetical protein
VTAPAGPARRSGPPELVEAVEDWLDGLVRRVGAAPLGTAALAPDLELVTLAQQFVDDDRRRDGVLLKRGKLTVDRLEAHESGLVDLEATVTYPADGIGRTARVAAGRALEEITVRLGALYWTRDEFDRWALADYVRDERRMSTVWCTHPLGEDVDDTAGLSVVPQAISVDGPRVGRLFLEVHNARDTPVTLRIGRPDRPKGIFRRSPAVTAPDNGIPVPAGSSTHLVGRTSRLRLTDVEIFAFDPASGDPAGELRLLAELPKGHPGDDPVWCQPAQAADPDA